MNMFRLFFYLIITLCPTINAESPKIALQPAKKAIYHTSKLTINQAVDQALKYRPDLGALKAFVRAQKESAHAALAGHYPTINLTSSMTQGTGLSEPANATILNTNQLIYSFSGPLQLYKRAKKFTQVSQFDEDIQKNNIRLQVETAFLQTYLLQENDRTIISINSAAAANFEKSESDNAVDLLDKNVHLKNSENYALSISNSDQFYDDLASAHRNLEFLIGKKIKLISQARQQSGNHTETYVQLLWDSNQNFELLPLARYYNYAIKNRPEVPQGLKRAAIEYDNIKIAQGQRLPIFTANAQVGYQGAGTFSATTDIIPSRQGQGFYSLTVAGSWSIFDGLVTQYQERQARANRIKELLGQEQTVLNIKQDVQAKYFALSKAITQLKAQKISYVRAHNDYVLSKQQLDIGQIASYEFQTAQAAWEREKYNWTARNVEAAMRERELMFACGYPEIDYTS